MPDIREVIEGIQNRAHTLNTYLRQVLRKYQLKLKQYQLAIGKFDPKFQLQEQKMRLAELEDRLSLRMKNLMTEYRHRLEIYTGRLHGLSPTAKLINGYGYLEQENGDPLVSSGNVKKGDRISVIISDGTLKTRVEEVRPHQIGE